MCVADISVPGSTSTVSASGLEAGGDNPVRFAPANRVDRLNEFTDILTMRCKPQNTPGLMRAS